MFSSKLPRLAFWAVEFLALSATVALAAVFGSSGEWSPVSLVAVLLLLAFLGQWFSVEIRGGQLGASMIAIVLAMGLLGPVPAAACGLAAMIVTSAVRRLGAAAWLDNLASLVAVPFAAAWLVRAVTHGLPDHGLTPNVTFGLALFGAFLLAVALTFALFALDMSIRQGHTLRRELRELIPLLPGELAAGVLATILAVAYRGAGPSMLFAAIVVLLVFQRLTVALLRSEDRAEQLLARSRQLVGLQLGVLRTLVRALAMRDERTARHAASVASYAKALAAELGCSAEEQDMVHTAGLLHDIGKFTWPDRILKAQTLEEEDLETVRSHPQEGSILVGALDGYGEVADAVLYHHERVDGRGYPAGLIGPEIPLGSRILAICSSYDTMTASSSYRPTMTREEAREELRSAARNGQLDPELVERFIALLEREGPGFAQDADFETELDFERRVRTMATPAAADDTPSLQKRGRLHDWRPTVSGLRRRTLNRG